MELDALFLVNRCCVTADFSEADVPVVLLRPGLSRQIGLPSIDLITLKTNCTRAESSVLGFAETGYLPRL
jgi:hypothetical protein